jgi:hypothetical protein
MWDDSGEPPRVFVESKSTLGRGCWNATGDDLSCMGEDSSKICSKDSDEVLAGLLSL